MNAEGGRMKGRTRSDGVADTGTDAARQEALQWALQRGSRSGRVAWQFARDWVGRTKR